MTAASRPTTLIERYQAYRVRRWLVREKQLAGMLPGWRTRSRRRALAITVITAVTLMFIAGVLCAFGLEWAALIAGGSALLFLPAWTALRIVSRVQDSAPAETLDELEMAERDSARSIGLTVTQSLCVVPLLYLVFSGATFPEADAFRTAYAGGVMLLGTLLAGGAVPAIILAWSKPDAETES